MLNLFYEEPDPDRWVPFDRYLRRLVRRVVRGRPRIGGQQRVFLNLCAGLDRLGIDYRVNDYRYIRSHPDEVACIVGKPFVLDKIAWRNPIVFGAAGYSHPTDDLRLLERLPVRKILVPGPWMVTMCKPYWGDAVEVWPVGIDTDRWRPTDREMKSIDVLLYDKIMWSHSQYEHTLIQPIRDILHKFGRSFFEIRYGFYKEEEFWEALRQCRVMIFLCEHETQGIAYQQALSCDVPIFAWDRGGYWQDPGYYPQRVRFAPVSSVPYWDARCGAKFQDIGEFANAWEVFWARYRNSRYSPRDYILEELTLEKCAKRYVEIVTRATVE